MTFASVDRTSEGTYLLKPLKQKQMVDGLCYLLQEIYGIENKNPDRAKVRIILVFHDYHIKQYNFYRCVTK